MPFMCAVHMQQHWQDDTLHRSATSYQHADAVKHIICDQGKKYTLLWSLHLCEAVADYGLPVVLAAIFGLTTMMLVARNADV